MSEENKEKTEPIQRFTCVCAKCGEHDSKSSIEFNFRDRKIYQICAFCHHHNFITIDMPAPSRAYPKIKTM